MAGRARRRVGVFGGTFDPPHYGHLSAASEALEQLDLDLVLLTVANDPWQKTSPTDGRQVVDITSAGRRLAMVAAAVEGLDGIEADDIEIRRGGPTYTADTLVDLENRYPGADLLLLVGVDVATHLDTWLRPDEIRERATIVVMTRPGSGQLFLPEGWEYDLLQVPAYDISSSEVRRRVAAGEGVGAMVPPSVILLIEEVGLYRDMT